MPQTDPNTSAESLRSTPPQTPLNSGMPQAAGCGRSLPAIVAQSGAAGGDCGGFVTPSSFVAAPSSPAVATSPPPPPSTTVDVTSHKAQGFLPSPRRGLQSSDHHKQHLMVRGRCWFPCQRPSDVAQPSAGGRRNGPHSSAAGCHNFLLAASGNSVPLDSTQSSGETRSISVSTPHGHKVRGRAKRGAGANHCTMSAGHPGHPPSPKTNRVWVTKCPTATQVVVQLVTQRRVKSRNTWIPRDMGRPPPHVPTAVAFVAGERGWPLQQDHDGPTETIAKQTRCTGAKTHCTHLSGSWCRWRWPSPVWALG